MDEVRIEYGPRNLLGEYGCHATLNRNGILRDRNCYGFYEDGRPTLSHGVKKKEALSFLSQYRFEPLQTVAIKLPPTTINGTPPMPAFIMIQRAEPEYAPLPLERKD